MSAFDHAKLAARVVEATIHELPGHFRKGKPLKRFYRDVRNGRAKCFVVLRDDPDDFVGLLLDRTSQKLRFELLVNIAHRDDAVAWAQALQERRFGDVQYSLRTPDNPVRIAMLFAAYNPHL
jgi:hypothetical protein